MPDAAERFIAAATAPMADNPELQIAARNELREAIARADTPRADSLEQAAEYLEHRQGKKVRWWWTGLLSLAALAFAVGAMSTLRSFADYSQAARAITGTGSTMGAGAHPKHDSLSKHLNADQRLLLLGDITKSFRSEQKKALWESDPGNPAFFADYVTAHTSERGSLPPDYAVIAGRIDPGNAWFPAIAAGMSADEGIARSAAPVLTPGGSKIGVVRDQAKVDEAIKLMHEAARLPRFDSYSGELLEIRIPLLPPRTDSVSQLPGFIYLAGLPTSSLKLRHLSDAVKIKAWQLGQAGDAKEFRQLLTDWEKFNALQASARSENLVDALISVAVARGPLKVLAETASVLNLPEEEKRLSALDARFEKWSTEKKGRSDPNKDVALRSSLLAGLTLPAVSKHTRDPVAISPDSLTPGRMADHALATRLLSVAGWHLLGLGLLAAFFYRFRSSSLTRRLSRRMELLLRPMDWIAIIGIGIIAPLMYYHLIRWHTVLGGLDWSLKASAFIVPAGQFSSMLWLMLVLPVLIARRRLSLRGGYAGLGSKKSAWGWISVACGIIALPLFGAAFLAGGAAESVFVISGGLLSALQIYFLIAGSKALFFSGRAALLRRVTISRVLMPAYAAGILAMTAMIRSSHEEEKHWIAKDTLMGDGETPSLSRFEYEVTQQLQRELLEILDTKPR